MLEVIAVFGHSARIMLVRHSFIYLLGRLISAAATFASLWLFSRLFAPAEYGFYVTIITIAAVANMSILQWLRVTQMRFLPGSDKPDHLRQVVMGLYLSLLGGVAIVGAAVGLFLPANTATPHLAGAAVLAVWAMSLAEFSLDILRQRLQPVKYLLFSTLRDVALIGFVLLFIWGGLKGGALVLAYVAANLLPVVIWARSIWQGAWPPKGDKALSKTLFDYGLPLAGIYLLSALVTNADRLLLPWLASQHDAGLYGAAYGLSRQSLYMIMQSVNLAALPLAFKALEKGGVAEAQKQLKQNLTILMLIALPGAVGLGVLAPQVAHTLLGSEFATAAEYLLPWLAASALVMGIRTFYTDQAFQLAKATRTPMVIMLISALLAVPLSAVFIVLYGLHGAAYGVLAAAVLALALSWHLGQKAFPLPVPWRDLGKVALATLIMAACVWPLRQMSGWVELMATVSFGGAVYGAVVLASNVAGLRSKILRKVRKA